MYSLMIADDEIDKLESLRYNYNWGKYDISICCEAKDGMEAYELLIKENPDICIMDVRMPIINGLEAMKRAKDKGNKTKFVILSGYDDFDYAKKALSLSTVEYLLKPCKFSDVLQAVLKCVNLIEEEHETVRLLNEYRKLSEKDYQNMKDQFLVDLISGKIENAMDLNERALQFKFNILANYAVCVMEFDTNRLNSYHDKNLLFARILDHTKSEFSRVSENEVCIYNDFIVAIVSMKNITDEFNVFADTLESMITYIKLQFDLCCAIGISDIKENISACCEAYLEASSTAGATLFSSQQNVTFFAEMDNYDFAYPAGLEKKIITSIGTDENQMMQSIDEFFASYKAKSIHSEKHIQSMSITLIYDLLKVLAEVHISNDNIYQRANETAQEILTCKNLSSIKDLVIKFITSLIQKSDKKNIPAIAQRAVSYIRKNYCKKISLESVAEEIRVSPSYLSMLFKQHTGLNLTEYLNRYRVEVSKDLLKDMSLKTYEIARQVGFQDEKYFYLLFKRYTGLTASQYRDSVNLINYQ